MENVKTNSEKEKALTQLVIQSYTGIVLLQIAMIYG